MSQAQCTRCGQTVDISQTTYSKQGTMICDRCSRDLTVQRGDRNIRASALGRPGAILGMLLLSLIFDPFLIVSILAFGGAVEAYVSLDNASYRQVLGDRRIRQLRATVIALGVLAALRLIWAVVSIARLMLS